MTPEQLRLSILNAAFEGKLVEQRSSEKNADELFEDIRATIKKLIKEKQISKPKKMFPLEDIEPRYNRRFSHKSRYRSLWPDPS